MRPAFSFSLCADDYAMTPGVSRGILEALDAGVLTATSVMTTSRWWPESADALRPYERTADLGLHLNLTLGAPLGPMPMLAPRGALPSIAALMRQSRQKTLPLREIADEIGRQCEQFVAVFGRPPDHVDGHQHVHVLDGIRSLILEALVKRTWTPWVRDSADRAERILVRASCLKKAFGLAVIGRSLRREAGERGLAFNDGFAGFSTFDPASDYRRSFERFLIRPGRRHLVMCHPGLVDDELRLLDPVVETREQELSFLLSPAFQDLLARRRARLTRLTQLPT